MRDEQRTMYLLIAAIGAIPVLIALWQGGVVGVEPTIGLAMFLLAVAGLLAMWRADRRRRT